MPYDEYYPSDPNRKVVVETVETDDPKAVVNKITVYTFNSKESRWIPQSRVWCHPSFTESIVKGYLDEEQDRS